MRAGRAADPDRALPKPGGGNRFRSLKTARFWQSFPSEPHNITKCRLPPWSRTGLARFRAFQVRPGSTPVGDRRRARGRSSARPAGRSLRCDAVRARAPGQMPARMQTSQLGRRARHTRRPWRIETDAERAPLSAGSNAPRSDSTFTGSVSPVRPSRRTSRPTWVSTGRPGSPKADAADDVGCLTADSGQRGQVLHVRRHLAVVTFAPRLWPYRRGLRVLARKNPVDRMSSSTSPGGPPPESAGVGYAANRAGVTMLTRSIGALGRQDGGDQQLKRVVVVQGAHLGRRTRVLDRQPGGRPAGHDRGGARDRPWR